MAPSEADLRAKHPVEVADLGEPDVAGGRHSGSAIPARRDRRLADRGASC